MELDYKACRNLVADILHQALKDAAYGPLSERLNARRYIESAASAELAGWIDINDWPPSRECYERLRLEHRQRYI